MEDRTASEHRPILHLDMPCKQHIVGHHDLVSHGGVVPHMDANHQEIIAPYAGRTALLGGTMDRGIFPDHVVIADLHIGRCARLERKILGIRSDNGPLADRIAGTHPHVPRNDGTGLNTAPCSDDGTSFDDGTGAYLHTGGNPGCRINDGGRMNCRHSRANSDSERRFLSSHALDAKFLPANPPPHHLFPKSTPPLGS